MSIKELFTILLSDKPSILLKENEKELFKLIPELERCKGFDQNNEWHIYDVYEHILHVVDNVPNTLVLRLAALFHDTGKPISYTEDENKVGHFYGHWDESKKVFDKFVGKDYFDPYLKERVSKIITYHDLNLSKLDDISMFNIQDIIELYAFKKADLLAQNEKYHYILDDYDKQKIELLSKVRENIKNKYNEISTPEELMEFMDNYILYGWIDKNGGRHVNALAGLRENFRTSSLDEMLYTGLGTCIEQANMIKTTLEKMNYETKVFCHRSYETEENFDKEVRMHCFVLYKDGDDWIHFEHSNLGRKGIHKYDSIESAIDEITRYHREHGDIRKITEIPELPSGLSFKEFNEYVNSYDKDSKTK